MRTSFCLSRKSTVGNVPRSDRRGVALLLAALMVVVFVPVVGLAVDGSLVYLMRAKVSRAVDASVLAGARSLNVGRDIDSQAATASAVAQKFFNANLPPGKWGATNVTTSVSVGQNDTTRVRWVTITASADLPLTFMSLTGINTAHISLTGTAQRRDVNVVLVLDDSGSMQRGGAVAAMQNGATEFVNLFAGGRDNVGLVTFVGKTFVAYPPSKNFKSDSPNVATMINSMRSNNGGTGTAQALWKAWLELQNLNQPGALNVIVLFTDGLANAFTADFQPYLAAGSGCADVNTPKIGALGAYSGGTGNWGITTPAAASLNEVDDDRDIPNSAGCLWTGGASQRSNVASALTGLPSRDYYGNSTNGTGTISAYAPISLSPVNGANVTAASSNALDDAANRIRSDATLAPIIYCIGLGGNPGDPPDRTLMARIANDPSSASYNSLQAPGLFIFSPSAAQLRSAFQRIASGNVRLSY